MDSTEFRKELLKIMPGYNWTVHHNKALLYIEATGIKTSGFNRLSTLSVVRREKNGIADYAVKSSGFGKRAPFLIEVRAGTLARALRNLQNHYESYATMYANHANALQTARTHGITQ